MCHGPGHVVRYGNEAFLAVFGKGCIGLPARECLVTLPPDAFALLDIVLARGRPYARWIRFRNSHGGSEGDVDWRMTAAPRMDPTGDVYGVSFYLRARDDPPASAGGPAGVEGQAEESGP